jgi:hypothetical protein
LKLIQWRSPGCGHELWVCGDPAHEAELGRVLGVAEIGRETTLLAPKANWPTPW